MSGAHKFQVDLRGVIDLLSNHLYSGPQVYVRELLQNSVDAITARRRIEPDHRGSIRLEIMGAADSVQRTLIVHDDGVGLTESEVHEFLATIGRSSKRDPLDRSDFIGQFGIGLLSAFIVSDEIVVITRSAKPEHPGVEWTGRSDGTYSLRTLERDFEPGTQVFLRAKPGCHEFFEEDYVRRTAAHFGGHLPMPVHVAAEGRTRRIDEPFPWDHHFENAAMRREHLLEYGKRVFGGEFLDAIPLESSAGKVRGVAFVLPSTAAPSRKRADRVYLKSMLLSERADNLLPDWAFFVRCVVNADDLSPTAARDAFYEDATLDEARDALGRCLRNHLVDLARNDPERLERIVLEHAVAIKALALEDDEFLEMFADWLPFETTLGRTTLGEFRRAHDAIRYVRTVDEFRQIAGVATAQSIGIVNGGYIHDADLLERLPRVFRDWPVERVDLSDFAQNFEELSLQERDEFFDLVKLANLVLQPYRCGAEIRKFEPSVLPTLYTVNDDASFLRSVEQSKDTADELWGGVLDAVAADRTQAGFAQLCLNHRNPLIRRLAEVRDRRLARRVIEMLYVQALLLGHHPLHGKEMNLLNTGLLDLIEIGIRSPNVPHREGEHSDDGDAP
ncbi:MAG: HSP90 family protein [Planctomycetaceae bacterium]